MYSPKVRVSIIMASSFKRAYMSSDSENLRNGRNRIISISAFVDWNSQIHNSGDYEDDDPISTARLVLERTAVRIARCLNRIDSNKLFKVKLRLYHGWHKGFEPTVNKKAIRNVLASVNCSDLSPVGNVVFSDDVGYGDRLVYALSQRLHSRLSIHLPNTLRETNGVWGEKMVDTAIASDVIVSAFNEPSEWIMVVAEDDDLIPPVFTAEALLAKASSRVIFLHKRKRSERFVQLNDIAVNS